MSRAQEYREMFKGKDDEFAMSVTPLILCDILEVLMEIDMRLTRKFDEHGTNSAKYGCCGKIVCICEEKK